METYLESFHVWFSVRDQDPLMLSGLQQGILILTKRKVEGNLAVFKAFQRSQWQIDPVVEVRRTAISRSYRMIEVTPGLVLFAMTAV